MLFRSFIIIMLPLSVVLSTYMQLQIDVLLAKEDYSTKLLDSTYDGILSFEINSLSIDAAEGQSVKSYVSNAVNTFFNTMSINMGKSGASNINVQTYVPAILFTTYDGYYIYSPVKTSKVKIDNTTGISRETEDDKEIVYEGNPTGEVTAIDDNDSINYFLIWLASIPLPSLPKEEGQKLLSLIVSKADGKNQFTIDLPFVFKDNTPRSIL